MVVAAPVSVPNTPNSNSKLLTRGGGGGAPNGKREQQPKPKRPPLLPSEADNNGPRKPKLLLPEADNGARRPKSREVTSRYLSSTSSSSTTTTNTTSSSATSTSYSSSSNSNFSTPRRSPSPMASRKVPVTPAPTPAVNKRSQSAERRRPGTPRAGEMSMSAKMLMTSSRSLSVSFQGESFAFPVSKAKPKPAPTGNGLRTGTPERRKQTENSKPTEQHRWPGRSRDGNLLTRSVDFTSEKMKLGGSGGVVRALQKSMIDDTRIKPKSQMTVNKAVNDSPSVTGSVANSDHVASDTESVSSGGTSGVQEVTSQVRGGPRGVVVPARFWQETHNRLRRVPEPASPVSKNNKLFSANKFLTDGPMLSPRGQSSPIRGAVRPASPIRGAVRPASPSRRMVSTTPATARGIASPTRSRNGVVVSNGYLGNSPSILSYAAEARGGKVGENRIADAHVLKMLHNKLLQWRFANARADAAMSVQRGTAEKSLYNAWVTTTKLRHSVRAKRTEIQLLKQNLKMHYILKMQMPYLDNWDHAEKDHSTSLAGAIVALESSTLRLPVVAGAKADIQNMKDAICSAVDVMQAMASSICSLLTKVEHVNALVSELASVTTNESHFLDQCKDLLSTLTAMQVKDCSLRTHILQLNRAPSNLTMEL